MMPTKRSNFDETIILIKVLNPITLLTVDTSTTIRYLDKATLAIKDEFKMSILHARHTERVVDFTTHANYFVTLSQDAREAKIYETKSKKNVASLNRHQGEISCVVMDPKDRYMFSGGDDGGIFGVDIRTKKLALTLPRHLDTVTDIAFSPDGDIVATSSYDKNLSLFNLNLMLPKGKLKAHSAPVVKATFLSQNRLLSIDKKGRGFIWDILTLKVVAKLQGIHDDVTQIAVAHNSGFLFLGTKLGYILVYNLDTYELISPRYIKLEAAVSVLCFDESTKRLIIATDGGELFAYDVFENKERFEQFILEKKYAQMLHEIEQNPLLKYTKGFKEFDAAWEMALQQAKEFLERNDKTNALRVLGAFSAIASKRQFAQKLVQEYAEYEKFLVFVKNKKISLAYNLANMHPLYRETKVFKALEAQWEKTFALAKKYLLDAKMSNQAQEVLMPYRGISEKAVLIQELVLNIHVYRRFRTSISQKDFKLSFELIKQNPFLKAYPEYKALMNYSDTLYIKAQTLLSQGDTHAAIKIFRMLLDFEDFEEEAKEIILDIENRHKFFHAVETQNYVAAYNLLDLSPILQNTPDGKKLQAVWEEDFEQACKYALQRDVDELKTTLQKYINIRSKNGDIALLFSMLHSSQLAYAIREHQEQKKVENGIKNYILYYGLNREIKELFYLFQASYPESKLGVESQTRGDISKWRPSMMVDTIF